MEGKKAQQGEPLPLRVLHIAPTPFFSDRGCHMRIKGIVSSLNQRGIRNLLCTYHHGRDIPGIETVRIPPMPGYTRQEAGPSPFKYVADLLLLWRACAAMRNWRPDIVHGHLHEGALIGWLAKTSVFWRRVPLVFDVQGSLVGELDSHGYFGRSRLLRRIFWTVEFLITRLPQYFVCSSPSSREMLVSHFRIDPEKIETVGDAVDLHPSDPSAVQRIRFQLSLPEDRPIAVYSGALLASKGVDTLRDILVEARRSGLGCHFLIVGYPTEEMGNFVREHRLEGICSLAGRVPFEALADYLALARVGLEPKREGAGEGSGKLLNYMGAALPVVCFDTENNRTLLGDLGYYAAPGDTAGFVRQIGAVLAAREDAGRRGQEGRERVSRSFSWPAAAERMDRIYRNFQSDTHRETLSGAVQ